MFDKGTGSLGNNMISKDYPDYSIIKIFETIPIDLKRLVVNQTPVRTYQLTLE